MYLKRWTGEPGSVHGHHVLQEPRSTAIVPIGIDTAPHGRCRGMGHPRARPLGKFALSPR